MKYREEVHNAIINDNYLSAAYIKELILIGVKLGLEAGAARAVELSCGFHSPWEYRADVAEEIRDIHPGHVLRVKP